MEIKFCGNATSGNPSEGLCDEYRLSGIASVGAWGGMRWCGS